MRQREPTGWLGAFRAWMPSKEASASGRPGHLMRDTLGLRPEGTLPPVEGDSDAVHDGNGIGT